MNSGNFSNTSMSSRHGRKDFLRVGKAAYLLISTFLFFAYFYLMLAKYGNKFHFMHPKGNVLFALIFVLLLLWLIRVYNGFSFGFCRLPELVFSLSLATSIASFCMYIVICIYLNRVINPGYLLLLCAAYVIFNYIFALICRRVYFSKISALKTLVIYGSKADLEKLSEVLRFPRQFTVSAQLENPQTEEDIYAALDSCEAVFVAGIQPRLRNLIAEYCLRRNIEAFIEPETGDVIMSGGTHMNSFSIPIIKLSRCTPPPEFIFIKRLADIVFSLLSIVVLSPFMLISALLIKLGDHGPVFYRQVRLTKDGKEFEILKFRSMRVDAESDGVARLASENDDRITPVGHFLRACRMDELPQLFNVLKGDMSIVGPRPERPEIAKQYMEHIPSFDLRLQVKAGITGFAQVYGRYNTEPSDKLQMDLMYINNMSLINDLWLMFATFKVLFQKESTSGVEADQLTAVKKQDKN